MKRFFILINLIIACTFASAEDASLEPKDQEIPKEFYEGKLELKYSIFGKGASGAQGLKVLHDNNDWPRLVKEVLSQKSLGYDVYYYYLSKAARMMGYNEASRVYAIKSIESPDKCSDKSSRFFYDVCQGIDVSKESRLLAGLGGGA